MRARSNLALAAAHKPEDVLWEEMCFQAHQAVEKAIKAVYQRRGLIFRYTHDVKELAMGLGKAGVRIPAEVRMAAMLNVYSREGRYPGPLDPATEKDYRQALALARAVVKWAEKMLAQTDPPGGTLLKEKPGRYRVNKSSKIGRRK